MKPAPAMWFVFNAALVPLFAIRADVEGAEQAASAYMLRHGGKLRLVSDAAPMRQKRSA